MVRCHGAELCSGACSLSTLPRGTQTPLLHLQHARKVKPGEDLWPVSAPGRVIYTLVLTGSRPQVTKARHRLVVMLDYFHFELIRIQTHRFGHDFNYTTAAVKSNALCHKMDS